MTAALAGLLKREECVQTGQPWDVELFGEDLGREAEDLLGYKALRSAELNRSDAGIRGVFAKLGISPYTEESVRAYKREAIRVDLDARSPGLRDELKSNLAFERDHPFRAIFLSNRCSSYEVRDEIEWREKRWNCIPIAEYEEAVPDFALHKAIALKKECPEVEFFIDALGDVPKADPFLVAEYRGKKYYLAVWDEPRFTGLRENET